MLQKSFSTLAGVMTICAVAVSPALAQNNAGDSADTNPLMSPSPLPFHAARFDKIESSDFLPAIKAGIDQQLAQIQQIATNPEPPTFKNTLVALEKSGRQLAHAIHVFSMVAGANTNPTLQKVQKKIAPKLAGLSDAIFLNQKLFERVKTLYHKRDELDLGPESERLVEYYYNQFLHAGANLPSEKRARLKELNKKEATLMARFSTTLVDAAREAAVVVDDKSKLAGLSDSQLERFADIAESRGLEGKWVIPLENTTRQSILKSLDNRNMRARVFMASWTRAEQGGPNDTRAIVSKLADVRAEKAAVLGYDTYAAWKLVNQMAGTPENVETFLSKLVPASTAKARDEAAMLQHKIDAKGHDFTLQPWDWYYFAEKVRKSKYDLDQSRIKQYFELNNVLENGVFYAAHLLYGLTFEERDDLPVYQEDVRTFTVYDKNGEPLGLFYADYFKRDNKGGGAWMNNLVVQSKLLGQKPVIYNVLNIPKPPPGEPVLLTFEQVSTMFHEFGHALHGFFADQKYPSLSGTSVARDFVEFPSQFNEHWALYPKVLKNYAIHYKTGEPIPQSLIDKIKEASNFNQGYELTELLAAAQLDMAWHTIPASAPRKNVDAFEVKALKNANLYMPHKVPPRYRSSYFQHIWGNGYSAGYYAYLWTEMLSENAWQWFVDHGGLSRENGDRFRRMILSQGNTKDLDEMFQSFVGHQPRIKPMLKARGLLEYMPNQQ